MGVYVIITAQNRIYIKSRFRQDRDFLPANIIHKIISAQDKLKTLILYIILKVCFIKLILPSLS